MNSLSRKLVVQDSLKAYCRGLPWWYFTEKLAADKLFYRSNAFSFNSASVLLNLFMNWAWNVAWVLLFISTIFVSMSRPKFHLCYICLICFSLWIIVQPHEYRHTCSVAYFLESAPFFWTITCMKNVNNFQMAKVWPQGVA